MRKLIGLLLFLAISILGYYLNRAAELQTQLSDTTDILESVKHDARTIWTNRPDPADLSKLIYTLPWGADIQPAFHARGSIDTNRVIQVTLPAVPQALCADLLQTLLTEQMAGFWLRIDVNETQAPAFMDLAARKWVCADAPDLSVYFRF